MAIRCFVDQDGNIYSINENDTTAYPMDTEIFGDEIRVLGARDCLGEGREIVDQFQIWPSLTELAKTLEPELN